MKRILFPLLLVASISVMAQNVEVTKVKLAGPYKMHKPIIIDSVDVQQKPFDESGLFATRLPLDLADDGQWTEVSALPRPADGVNICFASFSFTTSRYTNVEVTVHGAKQSSVYVDGDLVDGSHPYQPGQYRVVVKYRADTAALSLSISTSDSNVLALCETESSALRPFSLSDNMEMRHYSQVSLSPSGKYMLVDKSWFEHGGQMHRESQVVEVATKRVLSDQSFDGWMPKSDLLLSERAVEDRMELIATDPSTMSTTVLCRNLPEGDYQLSPTEDFLLVTLSAEGPKKEAGVYEILSPEDRQPYWRHRSGLALMNLNDGIVQPLTFGYRSVWPYDLSEDGRYLIFATSRDVITQRPSTVQTLCRLDLQTMQVDTLVSDDGFLSGATLVPGTNKLLITGSPEALHGIGKNLPEGMVPNMFDYQLYVMDLDTKAVTPLTRTFDPSVKNLLVARNQVYFTAENADSVSLYKVDIVTGAITMVPQPLEVITGAAVSANGSRLAFFGTSACVPDQLYTLAIAKKAQPQLVEDLNADRMKQIVLGTCQSYRIMTSRGYEVTGHYYLPAHFDSTRRYPMIVHYYGGCSPTSRRFGGGSHYPAHYWNAMGYVVLVVNPSGASGFGQEWGARHVNTMGEGVAEDIIEMTRQFAAQHSYIDSARIGCVSASYGGFMTQLLLTKTDLFATGISHAGISDHTSYWGEGYWGYSYSEVSAANSYPWTRKDLYVDRSPLYNADKIHKPILFTHGTVDTNVPIGESIQMYTALKRLGVPTAFVMVEGENHGIMDYDKRQKWINTMVAWFHKWLQDDSSWWNALYTPKEL